MNDYIGPTPVNVWLSLGVALVGVLLLLARKKEER